MGERWNTQTGQLGPRTLLHKRYLIQKVIGRGGMGAVYLAKDLKRRGTLCAVKEMSLSMVPVEERAQAIQSFKIEAKMLWGLSHPNLPAFTNFFSEGQRYFLVMEYIDGQTLEDQLESQAAPFPERRVLRWAEQLCDVLEYLHSQHPPIIFRDMKPGNIMLTRQGHIKLIDFGIARFFRPQGGHDTQQLGTPGYASPEQYGHAQTDERSDIYSLGMTLSHLLTYHLPDSPIGVKAKNIQAMNPHISPRVARALEKATAPDPEMRYESVAAFRRALSGAASFAFETGEVATMPEELAELCARYPEEASEYLANGEIDSWLRDIGEEELARAARHIRDTQADPLLSVEQLLHVMVGPYARMRGYTPAHAANGHYADEHGGDNQALLLDYAEQEEPRDYQDEHAVDNRPPIPVRRSSTRLFPPLREAFVQVSPRTLDFGAVYPPGPSAPLTITIKGYQGLHVSGRIYATEPWIRLDRDEFDGMHTPVEVVIQPARLRSYEHYQGSIIIAPDGEEQEIVVTVHADVQGYTTRVKGRSPRQTVTPDEDDEEDLELSAYARYTGKVRRTTGGQSSAQITSSPSSGQSIQTEDLTQDTDQIIKYGLPDADERWEPCVLSLRQARWQRFGLAFSAALMLACFWYTWLSQLGSLLPPNPQFVLVLAGLVPTTTLGALFIYRRASWLSRETLNRVLTGMSCALSSLALTNLLWLILTRVTPIWLHMMVLLLATAFGAAVGTTSRVHEAVLVGVNYILRYVSYQRWPVMVSIGIVGGMLGYFLSAGLPFSGFAVLGILFGIAVTCALVWGVDTLRRQRRTR